MRNLYLIKSTDKLPKEINHVHYVLLNLDNLNEKVRALDEQEDSVAQGILLVKCHSEIAAYNNVLTFINVGT